MTNKQHASQDQAGFASIVVALIMIIVLGLTTLGFAKLSRQEQQSALNKQLASQAYYAAESGINDAYDDILNGRISSLNDSDTGGSDVCLKNIVSANVTNPFPPRINKPDINVTKGVSYSCVLVDVTPTTLELKPVPANSDRTISFLSGSLTELTVNWDSDPVGSKDYRSAANAMDFSPATASDPNQSWKSPAVLQFTLVPIFGDRVSESTDSMTVYMYPREGNGTAGTVAYTGVDNQQGQIVSGNCDDASGGCKVRITGLGSIGGVKPNRFLVHMLPYYESTNVTISGNNNHEFENGQAVIDVTGKAHNVLKRLQVRVPINQPAGNQTGQGKPNYAIEAQNICKRIKTNATPGASDFVMPTGFTSSEDQKICRIDQ